MCLRIYGFLCACARVCLSDVCIYVYVRIRVVCRYVCMNLSMHVSVRVCAWILVQGKLHELSIFEPVYVCRRL
jgi:hypothetical protein